MRPHLRLVAVAAIAVAACGGDDEPTATDAPAEPPATSAPEPPDAETGPAETGPADELFPDVLAVDATFDESSGTWRFDVTLSSPYDTPERYADAWRVMGPDGTVFGTRELAHDHANEQPFTRSLSGVAIPDDVTSVTVEGRDQVSGYGGERITIELVRS